MSLAAVVMKRSSKIVAGTLIGLGLLGSLGFVEELIDPEESAEDKAEAVPGLVLTLGISATGAWMFWQGHRKFQQQERDRLRSILFHLLKENNGHVTALQFAMEAGLEGKFAKAYLDDQAREFNAAYNISEEGTVSYHFDLGNPNRQFPESI